MINSEYYYEMNELANQCRRDWFIPENVPIDIFSIIKNKIKNLTIVFMDLGENISGASSKLLGENIIFINSKESGGRQRFDVAHELYHLKFDKQMKACSKNDNNLVEKKADQFASCLLMPHGALMNYEKYNKIEEWTLDDVINAEQYFQISHHAFLWRLINLEKITHNLYMKLKKNPTKEVLKRGYPINLYTSYTNNEETTEGNYIQLVHQLYQHDVISIGRRDELLLDVFRDEDIW